MQWRSTPKALLVPEAGPAQTKIKQLMSAQLQY
jgi:hypothetical protein